MGWLRPTLAQVGRLTDMAHYIMTIRHHFGPKIIIFRKTPDLGHYFLPSSPEKSRFTLWLERPRAEALRSGVSMAHYIMTMKNYDASSDPCYFPVTLAALTCLLYVCLHDSNMIMSAFAYS